MQSMFLWEEPPAKAIQSQGSERAWTIRVVTSCSPMWRLLGDTVQNFACGKMSPASFRAMRDETLEAFWDSSLDNISKPPPEGGKTAESCRGTKALTASHGECLTLNTLEFHSAAVASSLSDILETGDVPQEFFLSSIACQGILRRAEKRGKALPEALSSALQAASSRT
jgi:hypothetical protein